MSRFVRAEDFSVDEFRIVLGGRILTGDSILSARVEPRVSAELLGLCGLIIILITSVILLYTSEPILFVIIVTIMCIGVYREINRAWVLVLNIYQIGNFEVRGFTKNEASVALELVETLRGRLDGRTGRRAAHDYGARI